MACCRCLSRSKADTYNVTTDGDDDIVIKHFDRHDERRDADDDKCIIPLEPNVLKSSSASLNVQDHSDWQAAFMERYQSVSDEDGEVDAWQLRDLLNNSFTDIEFEGFPLDVCRSMVALADHNLSGQMSLSETRHLFGQLMKWKMKYTTCDRDRSGYIQNDELSSLLQSLGHEVAPHTLQAMTVRYSDNKQRIFFTEFVACMLKFTAMTDAYQCKQAASSQAFTSDEFIQLTMYS